MGETKKGPHPIFIQQQQQQQQLIIFNIRTRPRNIVYNPSHTDLMKNGVEQSVGNCRRYRCIYHYVS